MTKRKLEMPVDTRPAGGWSIVTIASALNVVGCAGFLILPALVQGAQQTLHMNDREVGVLSAVAMVGSVLSSLLATSWVRRLNWRAAARVALLGMLVSYGLSILFHQRLPFYLLQALAGFFAGSLYSLSLTILSDGEKPDRNFGIAIAAQVILQMSGLLLGPALLHRAGINSLLGLLAILSVLSLMLTVPLPTRGRAVSPIVKLNVLLRGSTTLALFGCFFYLMNATTFWTYIAIIAQRGGLGEQQIATGLAIGVTGGFVGALGASWVGTRIHRNWSLTIGAFTTIAAASMLIGPLPVVRFTLSCLLYNFAWNYSLTFQYAAVNDTNPSGHAVAMAPAFHTAGAAAGPAIAALMITPKDLAVVFWLVDAGVVASWTCFLIAARVGGRYTTVATSIPSSNTDLIQLKET